MKGPTDAQLVEAEDLNEDMIPEVEVFEDDSALLAEYGLQDLTSPNEDYNSYGANDDSFDFY